MTDLGDDWDEMLDDTTAGSAFEALLSGTSSTPDPLAGLVEGVRALALPAPTANEALSLLLAEGLEPGADVAPIPAPLGSQRSRRRFAMPTRGPLVGRLAALSLTAKALLGASVAVAAVGGAAATGSLPAPAQEAIERALQIQNEVPIAEDELIEAEEEVLVEEDDLLELQDTLQDEGGAGALEAGGEGPPENRFGARVSQDATGADGSDPGVDGSVISDEAQHMGQEHAAESRGNRPESAGPPAHVGRPDDAGRPDGAGPSTAAPGGGRGG